MRHLKKFNESVDLEFFPHDKLKLIDSYIRDYFSDDNHDLEKIDWLDMSYNGCKNIKYSINASPNCIPVVARPHIKNRIPPHACFSFTTRNENEENLIKLYNDIKRLIPILEQDGLFAKTKLYPKGDASKENVWMDFTVYLYEEDFINSQVVTSKAGW